MNDYKSLIKSDNPYSDLIAQEQSQNLQGAMSGATMTSPDIEAKIQSIGRRLGVPPESLRNNLPEAERQVNLKSINYDKMARELPVATDFLAKNAAIASDDVDSISGIEKTWNAFSSGVDRGSLQDELGPLHYKAMVGNITPSEQARRKKLTEEMRANQAGNNIDGPLDWFVNLTGYTGRQMISSFREGAIGAATGAVGFGATAFAAGQSGPQIALPEEFITVPAASIFGAKVGFVTASTVFNYKMESGFAYDEYENIKDETGELLPRNVAQGAAAAVGLLNAGLETIGDLALAKMIPGLGGLLEAGPKEAVKQLLKQPTFRAAIGQAAGKWAKVSTINGVTEALQELTVILGREVATEVAGKEFKQPVLTQDFQRIAQAGVEGAAGAAGVSIPGASVQAYSKIREAQRLKSNQAFMDSLSNSAKNSNLRKRMPDKFRELVEKLKERGPVDNVYIPAEQFQRYFQSVGADPSQIADEVGAANYREAQVAGTDVVIPIENYTTFLAATEHHSKLSDDIRLHQGDLTRREYEEFQQRRKEQESELIGSMEADVKSSQNSDFEKIKQAMVGELAGRFEPSTVDAYATTFSKAMITMAQRAGVDPIELSNAYDVRIQSPLPEVLKGAGRGVELNLDPLLDRLRSGEIPGEREAMGISLSEFIRDSGGLTPSEEVLRLDESMRRRIGQRKLAQITGMTVDEALELAIGSGYLQGESLSEADFLNALADDVGGQRVFSAANENEKLAGLRKSLLELQDYLETIGADIGSMDNESVKALMDSASQRMINGDDVLYQVKQGKNPALALDEIMQPKSALPETIAVDGVQRPTTNSNGKPIHPTLDGIKNFWRWFGESKVMDEQGRPLVVYHGTAAEFYSFDNKKTGSNDGGLWGRGHYFAENPESANRYAMLHGDEARVIPAYVSIKNPLILKTGADLVTRLPDGTDYRGLVGPNLDGKKIKDIALSGSHDGVIQIRPNGMIGDVVAYDAKQIKSATGNRGTFDPKNENILFQRKDEDKRGFIQIAPNRKITIALLEKANLSTFLHEMGHFHLEVMGDLAAREDASDQIKQDYSTLLDWFGVKSRDEIEVKHHEMYARANEAYLMEGKSPSSELRLVFQRFRAWLTLIYRKLSELNVSLNDDVRGVLDRIYATDSEIESASREMDFQPLFSDAASANMTDVEFFGYKKNLQQTTSQAKENLQLQLMAEYEREHQKWWKEQSEKTRLEVALEIDSQPVYQAFAALSNGSLPDQTPIKLDKSELIRRYGKEFLNRLPKKRNAVYSKDGGVDLESAAEVLGFDSGDQLVQALANMRDRNELVKEETKRRMNDQYGESRSDGSISEKAILAMHNESRADVMAIEMRALNRLKRIAQPVIRSLERAERDQASAARDIPPMESFRQAARGLIGQKSAIELNPYQYLTAQRRASRKAYEAATRKDYHLAAIEKQREMMNHFLYLESTKAKSEIEKIFDYQSRFDKSKVRQKMGKAGFDYLDQIDAIRERFEFKRVSIQELSRRKSLFEFAQQHEDDGLLVNIPDVLLDNSKKVNYKQVSVDELKGIYDTLRNIENLASLKNKLIRKGEKIEFDSVIDELSNSALENWEGRTGERSRPNLVGISAKEKGAMAWRKFDSSLIKIEQIVSWLDGGKIDGPWAKYVFDLADSAQTKEYELHSKVTLQIQDAIDSMPTGWKDSLTEKTSIVLPGFDGPLTRYTVLSMAFNAGNDSNYQRLRDGYGWTDSAIESALNELSADDLGFVQKVFDAVESMWPDIVDLEKRMTGISPPKIEATAIKTKNGEIKGGYFPLVYDPRNSSVGERQADAAQSLSDFMGRGYGRASTDKGHTKQRVDNLRAPVMLDFEQVLTSHMGKVVKDVSHRESIYSLNKILKNEKIRETLIDTIGESRYQEMNKWVHNLVSDRADTMHQAKGITGIVMAFRSNMAVVTMGWKISTMLAQFAGFGPSMDLVKPRHLTQALVDFNRHGPMSKHKDNLAEFVFEKSGEMRFRNETLERDVKDAMRRIRGENSPLSAIRKTAFYLIAMADRQVSIPTWLGAYRQAISEGMSEESSIRAGDRAVRLSQAAGGAKDLSAVQRDNEFLRLITMFYSPFSVLYSRLRDVGVTTKRVKDLPRAVARMISLVILPAVVGDLIGMRGPDEDEDEVWWAVRRSMLYPFASIPLLRDASSYLEASFIGLSGEGEMKFSPSFKLSPIVGAIDKLARLTFQRIPEAVMGERPWDDVAWDSLEMSGYVLGLPTQQVRISSEYIADVLNDESEIESPQQALRDLLFRRDEK